MSHVSPATPDAADLAPSDSAVPITSVQPGGGVCMAIELAWGRVRRWYLKRFRKGYVARMRKLRQGTGGRYPHEILDPRDLKYYRNQGDLAWRAEDDPFRWRDRLGVARMGLAEIVIATVILLAAAAGLAFWHPALALVPAILWAFIVWFFRNPRRSIPEEPGCYVAPADGRIVSIRPLDWDEDLGGPAVSIDIFLSIFNVHLNRVSEEARVVGLRYAPGKFLNALRPEAARENESMTVVLEESGGRRYKIRQITGAIARRIVCWVRPGERLPRGELFGMIKLGSRTELILPADSELAVAVDVGQRVRAGTTIVARRAEVGQQGTRHERPVVDER